MTNSEHYQLDDDVVFDSMQHLIKLWKNGRDAFLNINCSGGKAWLSFSTCLGLQSPHQVKLEGIKPELRLTEKKEDRKQKQAVFTQQKHRANK